MGRLVELPARWHPRWLTEPFLKEIVITPAETWWINEQQSEVRRIYTDGRSHVPADEAYPLWEGDFDRLLAGDTLVVHTNNLMSGQYQRGQPDYSDKVSTIERESARFNPDMMEDRVTVYDPGVADQALDRHLPLRAGEDPGPQDQHVVLQ